MDTKHHGLSIGIERIESTIFMSLKVVGQLTHEDYLVITPMLESAIEEIKTPNIDVLFDASEMDGWELQAAWDDLKLGLKHSQSFQKIAIFGGENWQKIAVKIASWFIGGEIRFFNNKQDALLWIQEN